MDRRYKTTRAKIIFCYVLRWFGCTQRTIGNIVGLKQASVCRIFQGDKSRAYYRQYYKSSKFKAYRKKYYQENKEKWVQYRKEKKAKLLDEPTI